MPFDSSATSSLATSSRAPGEEHRDRGSGDANRDETMALNLGGARRRLVRFDPETGKPVPLQYWEIVPDPPKPR